MKFHVNVTGEFHNIQGLRIAQKYFMTIQCGACGTTHKNTVFISKDTNKIVKVKELPRRYEVHDLTVKCKGCDNLMCIRIHEPEQKIDVRVEGVEEDEVMSFCPVVNDAVCHISTIQSDVAVVKDVDGLILDAVNLKGQLFENLEFQGRVLAEDDMRGDSIDIRRFAIDVVQA